MAFRPNESKVSPPPKKKTQPDSVGHILAYIIAAMETQKESFEIFTIFFQPNF